MGPGQLWRDYMKEVLDGVPVTDWERPANIVQASVVAAPGAFGGYGSGLLPSNLSPFSMTEFFVRGTVPTQADNWWVEGCPGADGSRRVALKPQERAPGNVWQKYTDAWIKAANAGVHNYGRYSWNLIGSEACPTFSPSPSPSPSPSTGFTPGPTVKPSGTPFVVPSLTLPPFPSGRTVAPSPTRTP
jgi:hypothetical protein